MNIFTLLRSKGHRITPQREEVLKALSEAPRSAEEIYEALKSKKIHIDLASVYRTVQLFVENSIIQQIEFGDGKKRYEIFNEENHHHHLICNNCGNIQDIALQEEKNLLKQVARDADFKITKHSLEFFGLCKSCQ